MIAISRTGRLLRRLVRLSCRRPAVTVAISLLLAVVAVVYTMQALTFKTSTRALLPQDAGFVVRYAEYAKEFGELEDIVVVVEARLLRGRARLRGAPHRGAAAARRSSSTASPTASTPSASRAASSSTSPPPSCAEIRDKIFDHQEFMESFAGDPSLARLLEGVNTQMAAAFVSNLFDIGLQDKDLPVDTRFLRVLLDQMASRLERPGALPLAVGHPLLLRRGPARRRGLLPLRRQEPALHPGRDPAQREGQLHRRPGRDRDHPRRRSPGCGPPSPTCRPA